MSHVCCDNCGSDDWSDMDVCNLCGAYKYEWMYDADEVDDGYCSDCGYRRAECTCEFDDDEAAADADRAAEQGGYE